MVGASKEKDIITCDEYCLRRDDYVQCVVQCLQKYNFDEYEIDEALKYILGLDY